ncbi:MAG: hypothetical protein WCP41_03865 [Verrucomicrobiota bacterium]
MKTATKTTIRPSDDLWQWAALKRSSDLASKYPVSKSRHLIPSQMAKGILNRLCNLLRVAGRSRH